MEEKGFRIVFMGTSDFAVPSLEAILHSGYEIAGVVTAPDREAGRGRKLQFSPVKEFALAHDLHILQPPNLKEEAFHRKLAGLQPDLQVVVAFRMLPREVWSLPSRGTINLHASLLPQYRGAAPINHAIINGETKTGLTTFFIDEKIDTGTVILQRSTGIGWDETFGEVYQRLRSMGPELLLETIRQIQSGTVTTIRQEELSDNTRELKPAPKIFREDCAIDFHRHVVDVYNFIRGLSPYPAAYALMKDRNVSMQVKIFRAGLAETDHDLPPGTLQTDGRSFMKVAARGGWIHIHELQLAGKKRLGVVDFLNGHKLEPGAMFVQE